MTTKNSLRNDPEISDDFPANKRLKTDHENNLLQQHYTPNETIVEQTKVDKAIEEDHGDTYQTTVTKDRSSDFEMIPNELFFQIFSYMNQLDIIHAFFGLNQRFYALTLESIRQFKVLESTPLAWYIDNITQIANAIELISLNVKSVPNVFSCNYSFPNLRSIIIKQRCCFTVKLNVKHCSGLGATISCLNLLRMFSAWTTNESMISSLFAIDSTECTSKTRMDTFFNTLPCPAIERLSVNVWDVQDWICLCGRMPNLTHLQIIYEESEDLNMNFLPVIITSLISGPSHLTNLHIIFGDNPVSLESLEWLISHCHSSLKQFTLSSAGSDQINGKRLENLLQPCLQLTKLTFDIEYYQDEMGSMEMLRQFQTDWWLDPCRPPVFLQRSNTNRIFIVTMPCTTTDYVEFEIDSNRWLLNKGRLDSPFIRFSTATSIHILNSRQQPITMDFLRLIAHVFHAPFQSLNFTYWAFDQPQILYEQVSNRTAILPRLPHVRDFNTSCTECDGLDAMSLTTWLLVAPNVKELNIAYMSNDNKFQLAKDLDRMLQTDLSLKLIFNRIEKMIIFSFYNKTDESAKMKLFFLFLELFPEAVIHYL